MQGGKPGNQCYSFARHTRAVMYTKLSAALKLFQLLAKYYATRVRVTSKCGYCQKLQLQVHVLGGQSSMPMTR